jgi:hypothetical protein
MVAERLSPQTVNTYLSLLGTILNAAVDDEYLPRSPLVRQSGAGRTVATRIQPVTRREVWLLREQLHRLAAAIDPRYRALVLVAALTGMRWGELVALRWDDPGSTCRLTTGRSPGPGGCGSPGRSATRGGPAWSGEEAQDRGGQARDRSRPGDGPGVPGPPGAGRWRLVCPHLHQPRRLPGPRAAAPAGGQVRWRLVTCGTGTVPNSSEVTTPKVPAPAPRSPQNKSSSWCSSHSRHDRRQARPGRRAAGRR